MVSKAVILFYFHSVVINIAVYAQTEAIGRIFIGTQGNRSDSTEYTFNDNINAAGIPQPTLPFSAVVFSGADGSEISKNDTIEVACYNEFNGVAGYTQLTFTSVTLLPAVSEGIVKFSMTTVGRAAVVRCYGISQGFSCPATADSTIQQPQFCRESSMSDPITITLKPAPVVSICERVSLLPRFTTSTYSNTFNVALSEAVNVSSVRVTCQDVDPQSFSFCQQPGANCCQKSGTISVTATDVTDEQTTASMEFVITQATSDSLCVGVRCQADSAAQLAEGYFQYLPTSSSDSSSEGLFKTESVEVKMEPQYFTVYNTSFQSLLYLGASTGIPFQCQASVVDTLQEAMLRTSSIDCTAIFASTTTAATTTTTTIITTMTTSAPTTTDANATTGASTVPPTTTPLPTPVDPSSPWITVDNSFTITSENNYYVVRTNRQLLVIAPVQEIVVTTCCSTLDTNLIVATVAVADLKPRMNNTGGVVSGGADSERFVVNPAYKEVAPCPCDLTYLACDINCCCDGECSDAEKETFSGCIPGPPGGLDPGPDLRSCKSDHFPKDDWFPLMCVQFESNALLGEFYTNTGKLSTATAIKDKLVEEKKTNVYTYQETEARFSDLAVVNGYTVGSNILTSYSQNLPGNLLLPQQTSSGHCLDSTPVQFLRDSESTCTRTLTEETCADLTPFSARVYVEASSLYNPACPRSFTISSTGRSLQGVTQQVDVQVNYYCTTISSSYVKATSSSFSDLVSPQTVDIFRPGLENVNCTELCGSDSSCLDINQGQGDPGSSDLPPRCASDNSFVLPPIPTYQAGTSSCSNVVLDVRYRFSWAGQIITGLTADVILGNVPLGSAPGNEVQVSQKFAASFTHDYSGAFNQTDNYGSVTVPYQRSGRPGYDFGKPIATGCKSTNETTGTPLPVNQNEISQMAVWSPGIDGLCSKAKRRFLTFGDDVQSSCVLRLAFNDIQSCDSLKQLVLNHLNVLMPANVVGRYGYNNPETDNMWIEILREDPLPTAASIPTNPTDVTTQSENNTFDPLSVRGGVCQNIVSGIHLEIMYAETGRNNRYPLLEIIGAAVRYSVSNWSMSCVGPNSVRCENNSVFTQPFLVHSSVQYTQVSPTTPHKPTLFYQIHNKENCDSDTCYRFYEDFDTSICHYDTCWHELFYPLTKGYQGYGGVNYTRGFSLLFVVFLLGYVSVTRPWR